MPSNERIRVIKEDLANMHEISTDMNICAYGPYKGDNKLERYVWALAVAMEHELTNRLKAEESKV